MSLARWKDKLWIRQSFMLPAGTIDEAIQRRRLMTTASFKFVDTTLGGNFAINAPPSYSRFADPRMGGRLGFGGNGAEVAYMNSTGRFQVKTKGVNDPNYEDEIENQMTYRHSTGMGAYYSEAIDDNNQIVVMRFGVPAHNSLLGFFSGFYSAAAAQFAKTARGDEGAGGIFKNIIVNASETAGTLLGGMLSLPFKPLVLASSAISWLAGMPPSKYYYLKPAMFPYWAAVQNIVNSIGVNLGIVPEAYTRSQNQIYGAPSFSPKDYETYSNAMPDIITPSGYIDVFAMATKAQRRANEYNNRLMAGMEEVKDMTGLAKLLITTRKNFAAAPEFSANATRFFDQYLEKVRKTELFQAAASAVSGTGTDGVVDSQGGGDPTADLVQYETAAKEGTPIERVGFFGDYTPGTSFWKLMEGELRDGANFVSFRVDYSGQTQESFNNEVGESGIAQQANSMSASARSKRFDWADGNVMKGLDTIASSVKGFVENTLDQVGMSGLSALAGSAFVDIPQVWQNATAQMPSASFTIQLRSPYANKLSQMQNLYIPLAMLLAGALPKMTGKHSYTEPFLVEMYCKGRVNIRMGIIDSITISRGEGNVGWNQYGNALGIDVTFSVKDLSTVMMMPLTTQFTAVERAAGALTDVFGSVTGTGASAKDIAPAIASMYDDDNAFTDYMAALGSLGFQDLVYAGRKWRLNRIRYMRSVETLKSPAMWSNMFVNATTAGRLWNALAEDTDRPNKGF